VSTIDASCTYRFAVLTDLELLRTLVIVAESRTFGEAAARRHLTTSAVSQQMKSLERQLGAPLFERVGRNAVLTAAGARLAGVAAVQLRVLDDAVLDVARDHNEPRGPVRLGAPRPFARVWARPRLARLLAAMPLIELEMTFDGPSALEASLVRGEIDLAILVQTVESPSLAVERIGVEEFVAVASPRYVDRVGVPRDAADFARLRHIAFDRDLPMLAGFWRAHFGRTALPTAIGVRVASLDEMLAFVEAGLGIAVLPDYFVADALERGAVVRLDPATRRRGRARNPIYLAWRRSAVETARLVAVRDALLARS